jgi:hypothetical protein
MKTLIAIISLSLPANANEIDLTRFYDNAPVVQQVHKVSTPAKAKPKKKVAKKNVKKKTGYGFRSPSPPPPPSDSVTKCLPPVRVVGSQWATESGAEESARKAWAEQVRFSHGESYMALEASQALKRRCTRSSIGEIAGQTLHRCEIEAMPCRPGLTEVSK